MHSRAGVTLIEAILVSMLIFVGVMLAVKGSNFINRLYILASSVETQKQTEIALYEILRDVRNSKRIDAIAFDRITLTSFNFKLGYSNPALLNPANETTIQYQYAQENGIPVIRRTTTINSVTTTSVLLKGTYLKAPSNDANGFWFRPIPETATASFDAVELALRVQMPITRLTRTFRVEAMKRGS